MAENEVIDDEKIKRIEAGGWAKGFDMGKAILSDSWDRQAHLMERKQREQKLCRDISEEALKTYNRGFVKGLFAPAVEGIETPSLQKAYMEKIQDWVDNLVSKSKKARDDGERIAEMLYEAMLKGDRLKMSNLKKEGVLLLESTHLGIQKREFRYGYSTIFNGRVDKTVESSKGTKMSVAQDFIERGFPQSL